MLMDAEDKALPVVGTVASAYAHPSMDELYARVAEMLKLPKLVGDEVQRGCQATWRYAHCVGVSTQEANPL